MGQNQRHWTLSVQSIKQFLTKVFDPGTNITLPSMVAPLTFFSFKIFYMHSNLLNLYYCSGKNKHNRFPLNSFSNLSKVDLKSVQWPALDSHRNDRYMKIIIHLWIDLVHCVTLRGLLITVLCSSVIIPLCHAWACTLGGWSHIVSAHNSSPGSPPKNNYISKKRIGSQYWIMFRDSLTCH